MKAGSSTRVRQMVSKVSEPVKILIVDDDAYFRTLVNRLLTAQGYEVLEARSANEAESLLRQRPALAIIDYRLPNTDGAAFIKTLRDRGVTFPIVFCSGSTYSHQTLANVRNILQVDLIVRKPIVAAEFVSQLQSLLPLPYENDSEHFCDELSVPMESFAPDHQATEFEVDSEADGEPLITDMIGSLFADQSGLALCSFDNLPEYTPVIPCVITDLETEEMLKDLATLYLIDLPATMQQIREELATGLEQQNVSLLESAANRAHQVRGTAGSLGFTQLSVVCGRLEDYLNEAAGSDCPYQLLSTIAVTLLLDQMEHVIQSEENCYGLAPVVTRESDPAPAVAPAASTALRILVVDSSVDQCATLCQSLISRKSLTTRDIEAKSVQESLSVFSVLEEYRPDLLFIRAEMPGTSGYDICRMIRCNPRWASLPLVIMTDDCSAQCRSQIFDCGASDFVVTPIIDGELSVKLNTYLK